MNKNLGIKTAVIIITLLVFVWGIFLGTDPAKSWQAYKANGLRAAIQQNIHLGLDLRGGTHLILQVMVDEAVNAETDRIAESLRTNLQGRKLNATVTKSDRPDQILVKNVSPDQLSEVRSVLSDQYAEYDVNSSSDGLSLTKRPSILSEFKSHTLARSIETIRQRVDSLGVSEPVIQPHGLGENQILVQLPGVEDTAHVQQVMQETGMLEFRKAFGTVYPTREAAQAALATQPDAVVMPDQTRSRAEGAEGYWLISRAAAVSGTDVRAATPGVNQNTGQQQVNFTLTADAGRRFSAFTSANIGQELAVVLNGKVRQVATIQSEIRDQGEISGAFSRQEAEDLGKLLESGALPASIHYLEDRTVGASLGEESIRQGVTAAIVGMALVMVFMLIYYHGAGINANLGLILNLVILLGFLGYSGATLTLPGIAGVILTIGMGVDSNVLIFERIREEARAGKLPSAAVDHGFGRAWLTILDTHITTIVSALILFLFGSGPVRGFAVTLAFGLFANLFTAVFVSRVIFEAILQRKQRGEALSI
jgi:preprotein translocase subunit SecD